MSRRILVIVLLLVNALTTWAATPNRLGYQGNLADSGGNPITANLSISFRLYDVVSGGTALWSETQPAVAVDGGNFSVELGSVTPLPKSMFGRQLYLGIQIAGDSEMAPRPALTAAPFALRAGQTLANTILVSADGNAVENGSALIAAMAAAASASVTHPMAVEVDAGHFDLGAVQLAVPGCVTLSGRGRAATVITGSHAASTLLLGDHTAIRDLMVINTGTPATDPELAAAIRIQGSGGAATAAADVRAQSVVTRSEAISGTTGSRAGWWVCATATRLIDIEGHGIGGKFGFGLRADCDANDDLFIDGALLIAEDSSDGLRGAYLKGGGLWKGMKVLLTTNATLQTSYGLRVWKSPLDIGAVLGDFTIAINGESAPSVNTLSQIVGLQVENADLLIDGGLVSVENAYAKNIRGVRYLAATGDKPAQIRNMSVLVEGTQQGALGFGEVIGMRFDLAAGELRNIDIEVECIGQTYNYCGGFLRNEQAGADVQGPLTVENLTIDARTFTPTDASNQTQGFKSVGTVNLRRSSIRVTQSASELVGGVTSDSDQSSPFNTTPSLIAENTTVSVATSDGLFSACAGAVPDTGTGFEFYGNVLGGGICTTNPNLKCFGNVKRGAGGTALGPNCNGASQ